MRKTGKMVGRPPKIIGETTGRLTVTTSERLSKQKNLSLHQKKEILQLIRKPEHKDLGYGELSKLVFAKLQLKVARTTIKRIKTDKLRWTFPRLMITRTSTENSPKISLLDRLNKKKLLSDHFFLFMLLSVKNKPLKLKNREWFFLFLEFLLFGNHRQYPAKIPVSSFESENGARGRKLSPARVSPKMPFCACGYDYV